MKTIILSFDDSRRDFYTNVFPLLKEFNIPATLNVITDFVHHPQDYSFPSGNDEAMTMDQLKECAASGLVELACHGHTHKNTKEDVLDNIQIINDLLDRRNMVGFASPTSAITWDNKNEHGVWDLVEEGRLSYIRSGIRIRREGYIYTLVSMIDSKVHSNSLFWLLNKRTINPIELQMPLLNSTTIHSYTKTGQIKNFIKKAREDSAIILMFHSVKKRLENGYGADKFYFDYDDFRDIIQFLKATANIEVKKTIDFVDKNLKWQRI